MQAGTTSLFHNHKVAIDTSLEGLAPKSAPAWLAEGLRTIDGELKQVDAMCPCTASIAVAHRLAAAYKQTLELRAKVAKSDLDAVREERCSVSTRSEERTV